MKKEFFVHYTPLKVCCEHLPVEIILKNEQKDFNDTQRLAHTQDYFRRGCTSLLSELMQGSGGRSPKQ